MISRYDFLDKGFFLFLQIRAELMMFGAPVRDVRLMRRSTGTDRIASPVIMYTVLSLTVVPSQEILLVIWICSDSKEVPNESL